MQCYRCGAPNRPDASTCLRCGAPLPTQPSAGPQPARSPWAPPQPPPRPQPATGPAPQQPRPGWQVPPPASPVQQTAPPPQTAPPTFSPTAAGMVAHAPAGQPPPDPAFAREGSKPPGRGRRWPLFVGLGVLVAVAVIGAIAVPRLLNPGATGGGNTGARGILPALPDAPAVAWSDKGGNVRVTPRSGPGPYYLVHLTDSGRPYARVTVWELGKQAPLWAADTPGAPDCSTLMPGRVACLVGAEVREFDVTTGAVTKIIAVEGTPNRAVQLADGDVVTAQWERTSNGPGMAPLRGTLARFGRDGGKTWSSEVNLSTSSTFAMLSAAGDTGVALVGLGATSLFGGDKPLVVAIRDAATGNRLGQIPDGVDLRVRSGPRFHALTETGTDVYDGTGKLVATLGRSILPWDPADDGTVPVWWAAPAGAATLHRTDGSSRVDLPGESVVALCGGSVVTSVSAAPSRPSRTRVFRDGAGIEQARVTLPADVVPRSVMCDGTRIVEASSDGATLHLVAYSAAGIAWTEDETYAGAASVGATAMGGILVQAVDADDAPIKVQLLR